VAPPTLVDGDGLCKLDLLKLVCVTHCMPSTRETWWAALFGRRFWIPAYTALGLGLLLPLGSGALRPLVPIFLGLILFFTALKVDASELVAAARGRWRRNATLVSIKLLAMPVAAYLLTALVAPSWALGVALVAAMPAGLSSVAFADLYGGRLGLALLMVVATSVLAPFTAPLLLHLATQLRGAGDVALDWGVLGEQIGYVAVLLLVPFVMARLFARAAPTVVARRQSLWGPLAIASLCVMIFAAAQSSRPTWLGRPVTELLEGLAVVSGVCVLFVAVALGVARKLTHPDAVAFACNVTFVNHGLAVAFAVQFFPTDAYMLLPPILIQVPVVVAVASIGRLLPAPGTTKAAPTDVDTA
jgi:BASS family bile acid:Na+ symporter